MGGKVNVEPFSFSPFTAGQSHMDSFEESNGEQIGIASRTNVARFHLCSAYAVPLP
jgi:hypothetical protein